MNYNGKKFRVIENTDNGSTGDATVFLYKQIGNIVSSTYRGGKIIAGHLIGLVDEKGQIEMRYHQVEKNNVIKTGKCFSVPELLEDGRIRLHESWQWTEGDRSKGNSIIEEIKS